MSAHGCESYPWPAQTPPPTPPGKRKRAHDFDVELSGRSSKVSRQIIADASTVSQAETQCEIQVGNDIISCFPTADTLVSQHQWVTFVWNSNRPQFRQLGFVNIYLFHADSLTQILEFPNQPNPTDQAGHITAQVNDAWFPENGTQWSGSNITYPYYWVITRNDSTLDDGSAIPQSTFSAVQTTFADAAISSMASTSSAAAASSSSAAAAASSASVSSASVASTSLHPDASPGSVQSQESGSAFPHWAIAVIVVLGFLAIVATCILAFLILRRVRRRQNLSNRNSIGSASPMMGDIHTGHSPQSPLLAGGAAVIPISASHRAPSVVSPDGASTVSHANSQDAGPFSGADAAIMADAFRKALRKPDFAGRPVEEGESPDNGDRKEELLSRELAEEGRDIRSVSSSRGVKVETMGDSGDVEDKPH